MKTRLATVVLCCGLASCSGGKLQAPPVLFPVTSAWTASVDAPIEAPLATDGERIFVATRDGFVHAFGLGDGRLAWKASTGPGHLAAGPGVVVLRGPAGALLRLDPVSGAIAWRAESGVAGNSAPLIDADLIFVAGAGLAALAAADGRRAWLATDGSDVTGAPVAFGARLFVGEEKGALRCRDRATGGSLWSFDTGSALRAPVLLDSRRKLLLGTTDGRFVALSSDQGRRDWQWKLGADVQHAATLLRDSVLFASFEDVLYALDAGNGHMRWRAALPSRPLSAPILVGTAVVVACHDADVVGFDARSGRRLGALTTPAEIGTPPVVVGDRLVVGLRDHSVVALNLDQTPAKEEAPKPKGLDERGGRAGRERSKDRNP